MLYSCQNTSDAYFHNSFRINIIKKIINEKPIQYDLFDGSLRLSIYDENIKSIEKDSILIFSQDDFSYYLKQEPNKKFFCNTDDIVNNKGYYLIWVEITRNRFVGKISFTDSYSNIISTALNEGYKNIIQIAVDVKKNETKVEKCRFDGDYLSYSYVVEKFYKDIHIVIKILVLEEFDKINFSELFLMKNSIVVSDKIEDTSYIYWE
ncbi:MAG: hypothetical protein PHC47_03925 [Clostridia bacterium]|nr:hypothetical protein [Clostridia bacterium]